MNAKIEELERESRKLETNLQQRKEWLSKVDQYTNDFIDSLDHSKAFIQDYDAENPFDKINLDQGNHTIEDVLSILEKQVDNIGLNPASGGHLGYIPGGGIYPTALGDYMAAISNRYAGMFFGGPGAVRLENSLINWMCKLIGFPTTAHGNLSSGGSIANLIAITTARDKKGVTSQHVINSVVYLTEQTHHCVHKALRIAGLGECHLRQVPLDAQFRMDARVLGQWIQEDQAKGLKPFLIVASAGTTDTGSMDPLDDIATIAQLSDCWFHIDAAYGGFFILVDELKPLFKGIERADSVVMDPHKGLFLSYGLGAVLIKDVQAMHASHFYKANYMQDAQGKYDELSAADLSPELTKHFRGLRLWVPLMLHGIKPFQAALTEKYYLAQYFFEEIQKLGFEVENKPDLSVVLYRYHEKQSNPNIFNEMLTEEVHKDGRVFLSSTRIKGQVWLRAAILSYRTHQDTIDECLLMLSECVDRVKNQLSTSR